MVLVYYTFFVDAPEVPTNVMLPTNMMSPEVPTNGTSPEVPTNVTSPEVLSGNTVSVDTSGADHYQISVGSVVFSVKDHYIRPEGESYKSELA